MKTKKYDYKKKSNVFAILGGAAMILMPGTPVGTVLMAFAAVNAAGDLYWHPTEYADLIENVCPMPIEAMTEEELELWREFDDKINKLKEMEDKRMQNKKEKKDDT